MRIVKELNNGESYWVEITYKVNTIMTKEEYKIEKEKYDLEQEIEKYILKEIDYEE